MHAAQATAKMLKLENSRLFLHIIAPTKSSDFFAFAQCEILFVVQKYSTSLLNYHT